MVSKGSANSSVLNRNSTKFISCVVKPPWCQVPFGNALLFSQPSISLEILEMNTLWEFWLQNVLYFPVSDLNRSSTEPSGSCSDIRASTEARKDFSTPRCIVWNQSKHHIAGALPGSCSKWSASGFWNSKGSWLKRVAIQSGLLVSNCSNWYCNWPAWQRWQMPLGGFLSVDLECCWMTV